METRKNFNINELVAVREGFELVVELIILTLGND